MDPLFSCKIVGHGQIKLIALHGWMGDHRLFDPLHDLIDPARWSVAFPDCRGYGERRAIAGSLTVEEIAADAKALAGHLGWKEWHVLGHSMAGMAAQHLMLTGDVASAVLLAPVPASGAKLTDERRALLHAGLANPEARLALIDANTGKTRDITWLRKLRDLSLVGTTPEAMRAYMNSWAGAGFAAEMSGNSTPATVVIGELDPGTPEAAVRALYAELLPRAVVDLMPETGHYAMQERPEGLMSRLEAHFARL